MIDNVDYWQNMVRLQEVECENLRGKLRHLYRVFRALADDDRANLTTVDEMIQADVDIVVAERIRLAALVERLREALHESTECLDDCRPWLQQIVTAQGAMWGRAENCLRDARRLVEEHRRLVRETEGDPQSM